jgi:hypothetical protein
MGLRFDNLWSCLAFNCGGLNLVLCGNWVWDTAAILISGCLAVLNNFK